MRKADDDEKFSALAFKLMTDPFVGQLTFVRVYSGVLSKGDSVYNPVRGKKERIGRIVQMHANNREEVSEIRAGDIAACVGLKEVTTGETLCDPSCHRHARAHGVPRVGDLAGRRAEDQGRPGKDGHRPAAPRAGRPVVPRQDRRGIGPDHHLRHGRTAPRNHRGPHEARVRRGSQRRQAAGGLPRNHPQDRRRSRRQVRAPVGRQGPVRPRRAQDRAAGSRQGLRVRRRHQGRRGAARVHPRGRKGRAAKR